MNRKGKIIVSVVGIFIVLLALVGITYGYFLTRIQGNTNTTSISVTTADLALVYEDGNEIISATNITPDTTIAEKTFSVTNIGNTIIENYRVVLELVSIEGIVPSIFKYPKDFEITLTCVSKNSKTNEVSGTCAGFKGTWNNETFEMQKNTIAKDIRHEYSLIIKYVDSKIDQSYDMGKNLNLKVQIYGNTDTSTLNGTITGIDSTYAMKLNSKPKVSTLISTSNPGEYRYSFIGVEPGEHTLSLVNKDGVVVSSETITINKGTESSVNGSTITVEENQSTIYLTTSKNETSISSVATFNPYDNNTNTLAYHILNNAITNKNGTIYSDNPLTNVAEEVSSSLGTGEYEYVLDMSSKDYYPISDFDGFTIRYSNNPETACNGDELTSFDNLSDKYICLIDDYEPIVLYVKNYNATTETVTIMEFNLKEIKDYEKALSLTNDDYGISYYYRGNVEDNYVNFADMCWRIVRIAGDGTIKLILEDQYTTCDDEEDLDGTGTTDHEYRGRWMIATAEYGYKSKEIEKYYRSSLMDYLTCKNSGHMAAVFYDFQKNGKLKNYIGKLKAGDWCLGDKAYIKNESSDSYTQVSLEDNYYLMKKRVVYDAYTRLNDSVSGSQPTLRCNGTILNEFVNNSPVTYQAPMYVGALTADEIVYAGGNVHKENYDYYLINDYTKDIGNFATYRTGFRLLSPSIFDGDNGYPDDRAFFVDGNGRLTFREVDFKLGIRPSVSLKAGSVIIGGEGTLEKPYVIG